MGGGEADGKEGEQGVSGVASSRAEHRTATAGISGGRGHNMVSDGNKAAVPADGISAGGGS